MSTGWRFEVGGIYRHNISHRRVLILTEGPPRGRWPADYRHTSAYPLDAPYEKNLRDALDVYLDWNYPTGDCERNWELVRSVAVNPRTIDAP